MRAKSEKNKQVKILFTRRGGGGGGSTTRTRPTQHEREMECGPGAAISRRAGRAQAGQIWQAGHPYASEQGLTQPGVGSGVAPSADSGGGAASPPAAAGSSFWASPSAAPLAPVATPAAAPSPPDAREAVRGGPAAVAAASPLATSEPCAAPGPGSGPGESEGQVQRGTGSARLRLRVSAGRTERVV